jgi:TldD protein
VTGSKQQCPRQSIFPADWKQPLSAQLVLVALTTACFWTKPAAAGESGKPPAPQTSDRKVDNKANNHSDIKVDARITSARKIIPEDDQMLRAMSDELSRSMNLLQLPNKPKPYYLRYELTCEHQQDLCYEMGLMCHEKESSSSSVSVELRVGSYDFDSSAFMEHSREGVVPGAKSDYWGVRQALWPLTDMAYKDSLLSLAQAETYKAGHKTRHMCESFSKEEPNHFIGPELHDTVCGDWRGMLTSLSSLYKDYPLIRDGFVTCTSSLLTRRVATSEGTVARHSFNPLTIAIVAYVRGADGVDEWDDDYFAVGKGSPLPPQSVLEKRTRQMLQDLSDYAGAERREYYYGPILFENQASCELIEHGLAPLLCAIPGDNIKQSSTLLQSLNMRVLPEFISITDDPDIAEFRGQPLAIHTGIDADGINSQKVQLIDHGFLRGFLSGRTPIYPGQHSNGHNLAGYIQASTLIVEADPEHSLPMTAMRQKLLELARKRGLKEAIIVRRITPLVGLTLNGTPINPREDSISGHHLVCLYAVDVETGKETRIRGLTIKDFGRPQMDSIIAAGDDSQPITTANWTGNIRTLITPSLLVDNIELEELASTPLSVYPLANPYFEHMRRHGLHRQ